MRSTINATRFQILTAIEDEISDSVHPEHQMLALDMQLQRKYPLSFKVVCCAGSVSELIPLTSEAHLCHFWFKSSPSQKLLD